MNRIRGYLAIGQSIRQDLCLRFSSKETTLTVNFFFLQQQSTERKKMAAVHFTIIPCEPNRAISTQRKPYFGEIHPCTNKIVCARFEVFRPFLCVFMSGFRIFVLLRIMGKLQSPSFSVRWILTPYQEQLVIILVQV